MAVSYLTCLKTVLICFIACPYKEYIVYKPEVYKWKCLEFLFKKPINIKMFAYEGAQIIPLKTKLSDTFWRIWFILNLGCWCTIISKLEKQDMIYLEQSQFG